MTKFLCVHGHFYQPPRENPWLEEVEEEPSATPYHDWNARVFHECYGPNSASPVLDPRGRVAELVDNYRLISFDFGPTLLSWMERHEPRTYAAILAADRASAQERGGHGNAMAQAYNHTILPLASRRDKQTQVRWGLADFRYRFGREAEGMWLPECAADDETLEALASEGVRFTVLAPRQAARVRPLGGRDWRAVEEDSIDDAMPYRWLSKERPGRYVDVFFYNHRVAQAVAFEGLLHDGDRFARRLVEPFPQDDAVRLLSIATDGESYGHHHRWGNMALSFALRRSPANLGARLTNYGEFLSLRPPTHEVELRQPGSWSCAHGVRRWSDDCGCSTGGRPQWHQRWRKPLRAALDWLAGELDRLYEEQARPLVRDPWTARDAYIERLLGERVAATHRFLAAQEARRLSPAEAERVLTLCELQRHRMLMYTSCGWFFADVSGSEATQVLKYAARAVDLAESLAGRSPAVPALAGRKPPVPTFDGAIGKVGLAGAIGAAGLGAAGLSAKFRELLSLAPSNDPVYETAAKVYDSLVAPLRVDLTRAAAHFAVLDHLDGGTTAESHYAYDVKRHPVRRFEARAGLRRRSLSVSHLQLRHFLTLEHRAVTVAVHYRGRLDLDCWAGTCLPERRTALEEELGRAFETLPEHEFRERAEALMAGTYASIDAVFTDERRKLVATWLPGGPPERREAVQRWRHTARRLRLEPDALGEALRELACAADAGVPPDGLPDSWLLRRGLGDAFWSYAETGAPGPGELEALARLAQAAGLRLDLWELQAAFARRPSDTREAESLARLLNFAVARDAQALSEA